MHRKEHAERSRGKLPTSAAAHLAWSSWAQVAAGAVQGVGEAVAARAPAVQGGEGAKDAAEIMRTDLRGDCSG